MCNISRLFVSRGWIIPCVLVIITTNSSITNVSIIDIVYRYRIDRMEMTSLSTNLIWGHTNRVVSNRVVSKEPLYPSKTTIIIFCVF